MRETWLEFYNDHFLSYADKMYPTQRSTFEREQLTALLENSGKRILDAGCGYGRFAIPLASMGYQVTGVDGSFPMIQETKKRAASAGVSLQLFHLDLRNLDFQEEFDAVINVGTSFGFSSAEEQDMDILHRFYRALKPGGKLVLEIGTREAKVLGSFGKRWEDIDGFPVYVQREMDCATGVYREKLSWIEGGKRIKTLVHRRLYTATELIRMTKEAGFDVLGIYGGFSLSKLDVTSERMLILSEKPLHV